MANGLAMWSDKWITEGSMGISPSVGQNFIVKFQIMVIYVDALKS